MHAEGAYLFYLNKSSQHFMGRVIKMIMKIFKDLCLENNFSHRVGVCSKVDGYDLNFLEKNGPRENNPEFFIGLLNTKCFVSILLNVYMI